MTRKKVGLALSGGGARGFAHIGVLKVLVENDIPIDMIAGTSAGSIIGGAYASGMSIDELVAMSEKIGWLRTIRPAFGFGGMLSSAPIGRILAEHFPVTRFGDLKIPFAAVAFDLATSETVIFRDQGDLITAIRASCAVPGVFAPIRDDAGRTLVDGGVLSPMPVETVRAMGADVVIAVDLLSCGSSFASNSRTSIGIALQCAMATLQYVAAIEHSTAEIVIEPQIAHLRMDQIAKREEFISLGDQGARLAIDDIRKSIE
ncbi:MAG: patatin-like phospholipase family protein [Pyrinomonadaceae bacterium]